MRGQLAEELEPLHHSLLFCPPPRLRASQPAPVASSAPTQPIPSAALALASAPKPVTTPATQPLPAAAKTLPPTTQALAPTAQALPTAAAPPTAAPCRVSCQLWFAPAVAMLLLAKRCTSLQATDSLSTSSHCRRWLAGRKGGPSLMTQACTSL